MVKIPPLPSERRAISVEHDREHSPVTVGGPNTSTQITSMLGSVQIGFVVRI